MPNESLNFEMLRRKWPEIADLGAMAEGYVYTDPETSLVNKKRLTRVMMEELLLNVCQGHFVGISALAEIVERDAQSIRQQYMKLLVDEGSLRLAFPQFKNHPKQGYITH